LIIYAFLEPSVARQVFILLEQLEMQSTEMIVQLQNNTTLLHLLVGRSGGSHQTDVALPDDLELLCTTHDSPRHVEARIADNGIRSSLISFYALAVISINFIAICIV
jgi:hypothetical protein